MNIDNLDRQHLDIKGLLKKINSILSIRNMEDSLDELVWDINTLAGKLNIHMKTEDKFLYPELINSSNNNLRNISKEYSEEMGSIPIIFTEFKNQFNTKNKILNDKDKFLIESKKVLKLLENRIEKEDKSLYPKIKSL